MKTNRKRVGTIVPGSAGLAWQRELSLSWPLDRACAPLGVQALQLEIALSYKETAMATLRRTPLFSRQRVFGESAGQTGRGEYESVRVESAAVLGAARV